MGTKHTELWWVGAHCPNLSVYIKRCSRSLLCLFSRANVDRHESLCRLPKSALSLYIGLASIIIVRFPNPLTATSGETVTWATAGSKRPEAQGRAGSPPAIGLGQLTPFPRKCVMTQNLQSSPSASTDLHSLWEAGLWLTSFLGYLPCWAMIDHQVFIIF